MHKEIQVVCSCGKIIQLTEIQFDDFDCGMMGFLYCPECNTILLPTHRRKDESIKNITMEVEGEDRGWL